MKIATFVLCLPLLSACGDSAEKIINNESENEEGIEAVTEEIIDTITPDVLRIDITDTIFTNTSGNCADYVETYYANVQDSGTAQYFTGELTITLENKTCLFQSNAIPNHDFNKNGKFATPVSEQQTSYKIPSVPTLATTTTSLAMGESAVFLNGIKLDLLAAACYAVGIQPLGNEKIGCGPDQIDNPWRYDPMSSLNNFGTDDNNAHTQPDGTYHYHGSPMAMFDHDCSVVSPVIGFAFDGFPVIGPCINDNGSIRKALSSYQLKNNGTTRIAVNGYTTPVSGNGAIASNQYDGQFRGDWEFTEGSGDLDECNGMTVNGQYGYYVTQQYPWIMACYKGTPLTQ